ncbi:LysE family translocator [Vibrio sp. 16]|uniref:LysE family translocator n=1 Tax=Vibrio sp. 16 TaxID=391586 RepID=UPI00018F1B8F|nr:LysE family translocator [Vibrio sp. 16]EED25359.1 RhtB family transporter [Vibrio sp. 16]CAK4076572.1 Homoserine/homoserine lactone efflux protein [Vibrio sp. 16]
MLSPELTMYLFVTLLYAFLPGPAMLYSVAQTISGGRRAGIIAVFGLHVGGYVHVLLAVSGLSAVLVAKPDIALLIQRIGALYLIWIGVKRLSQTAPRLTSVTPQKSKVRHSFVDSIIVDVLNPKAALFYLAFLPQFITQDSHVAMWLQLLILGVVTNSVFSSADLISVLLASHLQSKFQHNPRWFDFSLRWAGSVFILLGVFAFMG